MSDISCYLCSGEVEIFLISNDYKDDMSVLGEFVCGDCWEKNRNNTFKVAGKIKKKLERLERKSK